MIRDLNHRHDLDFDSITHIDRTWRTNRIVSDHAALKCLPGTRQSFGPMRTAKSTLMATKAIRTIRNGQTESKQPGVRGEIDVVRILFRPAT